MARFGFDSEYQYENSGWGIGLQIYPLNVFACE